MADAAFEEPRQAELYDPLDPDRSDLDAYLAMADEFGAASVLDVGCGTGTLACLLAERGLTVIGADPAAGMLAVAQRKPGADRVRWLRTDAAGVPPLQVDLATMTGNVAQVFLTDEDWAAALLAIHTALRPGGRLVLESRDPARKAWLEWTREHSYSQATLPDGRAVESWYDLIKVDGDLVSFRGTARFTGGEALTSDSTLRFRSFDELASSVAATGLVVDEVRDASDRPGREFVFITRRPA